MTIHRILAVGGVSTALLAGVADASPPELGTLNGLPGDATIGLASNAQSISDLSFGGDRWLAVWQDTRTDFVSPVPFSAEQAMRDVYAARVDASGSLMDAVPIVVSEEFGDQDNARAVWNGQSWLVVWENQSPTQFYYASAVRAVRVAPDGTVLDAAPIPVVTYQNSSSLSFAVCSNGTDWLVVAMGTSAGENDLLGVRVAGDGTVLDPTPATLVPASYFLYFGIRVNSAAGEYLLSYDALGSFKGDRFQADLTPIGSAFSVPGTLIESNGTRYFVAWSSGGSYVGSPMEVDGTLLVPSGASIVGSASVIATDLAWSGTQWWLSWRHAINGLEAARISPNGTVLDPNGVSLDPANEPNLLGFASAGGAAGELRLGWTDTRAGGVWPDDVYSSGFDAAAQPGTEVPVSVGAPTQLGADAVAGPFGEVLFVFRSDVSGAMRILAQRVDTGGTALDGEPRVLASGPSLGDPAVSWDGSRYFVVWSDGVDVTGVRLDASGVPMDAQPFLVMKGVSPDVAALGGVFAVVATDYTYSTQFYHPFAVRVDGATGTMLDSSAILLGQYFARYPRIIAFGGRWLALWQRNSSHDDPLAELSGAFLEADGTPSAEFRTTNYLGAGYTPDLATSGAEAMVVFRTGSAGAANQDVHAMRVLTDGTFPDAPNGFVVSAATDRQAEPGVAWDGADYCAVWQDKRNALTFFDERTDIYGARIDAAGTVLDPSGFPVETSTLPEALPVVVSDGTSTLLASSVFEDAAPFAAYRIGIRPMLPGTTPTGVVASGAALGSGIAAWPNPFAGRTAIHFSLPEPGRVRLTVHDVAGRLVRTVLEGPMEAGEHGTGWDGRDASGRPVAAGIYQVRLETVDGARTGQVVRVR